MNESLAACSFIYPRRSVEEGVAAAAALGVRHVDIGAGGGNAHWTTTALLADVDRIAKSTRAALDAHGVTANECFALDFGEPNNSPDRAARRRAVEQFPRLADFAAAIGCRSVMQLAGPLHDSLGRDGSIACAADTLSEMATLAAERGLAMHIEPDCDSCVNEPAYVLAFCRQAPNVKLTLDYSHFIFQGFAQTAIEPLNPYAGHVHVRQAAKGRIVSAVDAGEIDMARLVAELKQAGYAGRFAVEYLSLPLTIDMDVMEQNRRMLEQLQDLVASNGRQGR